MPGERCCRISRYTYDPAGNITHIRDEAQQTIYLQQPPRGAEQRLHLRRGLPVDRGDRPRASGPGRRRPYAHSYNDMPRVGISFSAERRQRHGRYSSAMCTTRSAISSRCSIAAPTRPTPAGHAPTPTTSPACSNPAPDSTSNRLTQHDRDRNSLTVIENTRTTPTATCCACRTCRSCSGTSRTNCR